jgi:transcriptional regulator with XRE-family HTH domain
MIIDPKHATKQIGQIILEYRLHQRVTQDELGVQVYFDRHTVGKIEAGKTATAFADIVFILDKLGLEMEVRERPHTDAP